MPSLSARLPLAVATFALALAACDSSGLDPRPPGPAVADTLGTYALPARATYLRTSSDPEATDARPIDLAALGVQAGDTLGFYITGYAILDPANPGATRSREVGGVFSRSSALAAPDSLHRVVDAVAVPAAPFATPPTALADLPTDIDEDFLATRSSAVVPPGARWLFLAVADAYYSDNEDLGDGLRLVLLRR